MTDMFCSHTCRRTFNQLMLLRHESGANDPIIPPTWSEQSPTI